MLNRVIILTEYDRERFGNNKHSINRHSVRYYNDENGNLWILDRILDVQPRYFCLSKLDKDKRGYAIFFPSIVKINDKNYWGNGISWRAAEKLIKQELNIYIDKKKKK